MAISAHSINITQLLGLLKAEANRSQRCVRFGHTSGAGTILGQGGGKTKSAKVWNAK